MLNSRLTQHCIDRGIPLQSQVSALDAALNGIFFLVDDDECCVCCCYVFGYVRTDTPKTTDNIVIAQSCNFAIHETPPDRLAEVAFYHEFHTHPQGIEQLLSAKRVEGELSCQTRLTLFS